MDYPLPGTPLVWSPSGASDTLDASTAPDGAMASLQNLIPDPTTKNLWQARPAAINLVNFAGNPFSSGFSSGFGSDLFPGATFISCLKIIGSRAYGMVSTSRNPGHDEPFIYDFNAQDFIAITGVTAANTPVSPATSGPWNPPNLDIIGASIIISHPGFNGAGNGFFGVINISNPAAPTWTSGNTTTNALIAPPQWVQNFNGRCFFFVNPPTGQPAAYMSDPLNPTVITNANQILTFGDNQPLTCAIGLPLQNQLGGILQALMVFKGIQNIYQITGDFALSNLTLNTLNVATGTLAPNTVQITSKGIMFVAPDGLRSIDWYARVSDPVGIDGQGVNAPFISMLVPSRAHAAYNSGIYRVQIQSAFATGSPQQQWWLDISRELFSGPHTCATSLMAGYLNTFIVTLQGAGANFFQSDVYQTSTSTYVENGVQLTYNFATAMLPDTDQMSEVAMIETTLMMALVVGNPVNLFAQNQNGTVLDSVQITPVGAVSLWGAFVWGTGLWQGVPNLLYPRQITWHFPIVFRRVQILAQGNCASGLKIGRLHLRYEILGYLQGTV